MKNEREAKRVAGGQEKAEFREGIDYYFENGLMVLTAEYLRNRGFCCGSGCRHCPYPKKEKD